MEVSALRAYYLRSSFGKASKLALLSLVVEVAGVEPASSSGEPDILRAQPASRSTRLSPSRQHVVNKPSSMNVLHRPWNEVDSVSPLD